MNTCVRGIAFCEARQARPWASLDFVLPRDSSVPALGCRLICLNRAGVRDTAYAIHNRSHAQSCATTARRSGPVGGGFGIERELALRDPVEALLRYGTPADAARLAEQGQDLSALGYRKD